MIDSKHRQIKLLMPNQRWEIRYFVGNPVERLEKIRYYKAYWSISKWLNPKALRNKEYKGEGYKTADRLLLSSDLLFDLDVADKTFRDVQKDALEIIDRMRKHKEFKFSHCQFSGSKGLHIIYEQIKPFIEANPRKRFEIYQEHRNKLYDEFKDIGTLDAKLIKDLYRIFKIHNSIDHSTGYKVQIIPLEDLKSKDIYHILERIEKSYDRPDVQATKGRPHVLEQKSRARIRDSVHIYKWISNTIYGCKDLLVPYILLPKCRYDKEELLHLQRDYKLGDLFVFDLDDKIGILGLKGVSKSRLLKVLNKINSLNKRELIKRGFNKVRTSRIEYTDLIIDEPKFIYALRQDAEGVYSLSHCNYIRHFADAPNGIKVGVPFRYIMKSRVSYNG